MEYIPLILTVIFLVQQCILDLKHRIKRYLELTKENRAYAFSKDFDYLNEFLFRGPAVYCYHDRPKKKMARKIADLLIVDDVHDEDDEMKEIPNEIPDHDDLPTEPLHLIQYPGIPAIVVEMIPNLYENFEVNVRDFI